MAIITFNASGVRNHLSTIATGPHGIDTKDFGFNPVGAPTGFYLGRENYYNGSFNLGSGTFVTSAGKVLYDTIRDGSGYMTNLLLINKDVITFYYGINSSTMSVANGTPIGSGESVMLSNVAIRNVWAITSAGTAVVAGQGLYNRNMATI